MPGYIEVFWSPDAARCLKVCDNRLADGQDCIMVRFAAAHGQGVQVANVNVLQPPSEDCLLRSTTTSIFAATASSSISRDDDGDGCGCGGGGAAVLGAAGDNVLAGQSGYRPPPLLRVGTGGAGLHCCWGWSTCPCTSFPVSSFTLLRRWWSVNEVEMLF